jgi:Ran-binding protein 1
LKASLLFVLVHLFVVMPGVKLQEHAGNDKAWVWSTVDFSEESQKVELFAVRFGCVVSESVAL